MQDSEIRKLCEEELAKELGFRRDESLDCLVCDELHERFWPYIGVAGKLWRKCLEREKLEAERWIPVTERLPEEGKKVWVVCSHGTAQSDYYNAGMGSFEKCPLATHWRPLPSAPEVKA